MLRDKKKLLNRIRRIKGQINAIENDLIHDEDKDCTTILQTIAACRGAMNGLMAEVLEGHIRFHVLDPNHNPSSKQAQATQEVLDIIKMYLK